jgi:hypothetical protein
MGHNTVGAFIKRLMPCGSVEPTQNEESSSWGLVPRSPIDAFAVMATLIERSGAYRHVIAPSPDATQAFADQFGLAELRNNVWRLIAKAWGAGLHPTMDRTSTEWITWFDQAGSQYPNLELDERLDYKKNFGVDYASLNELADIDMNPLQELWNRVATIHRDSALIDHADTADWWEPAIKVMILADMACSGVGFWPRKKGGFQTTATTIQQVVLAMAAAAAKDARDNGRASGGALTTLTSNLVDSSFCAVLPKTRTSAVGCTLRSMTHNLALLPPSGLVEARWRIPSSPAFRPEMSDGKNSGPSEAKPLNLLLIPFPYRFGSECFTGDKETQVADGENAWSYFHLKQYWLDRNGGKDTKPHRDSGNQILSFVREVVKRAKSDMVEIHAIAFPEYALNKDIFENISSHLFEEEDELEFIVAGLSEEPNDGKGSRHGNFVAVRGRPLKNAGASSSKTDWSGDLSREKHHRWKLDARQIERYGISNKLNPARNWWEGIPLGKRVIDFIVPRAGTAMTVLICEDLARADPVQTVVRAIGPNLVLALLMDGPQRKSRWPGHYAGVLADDPGCSVLTFTSLALIARGMTSDRDQSRSVAFFKNSLGMERELFLPQGAHALALRLTARSKAEHSLDGRSDGGAAYIWELREVTPVRAHLEDSTRWIVEGST